MVLRIRRAQPGTSSGSRTPRRRGLTGDASDPPHAHTTRGASAYAIIRLFSDRSRDARTYRVGRVGRRKLRSLPARAGAAFGVAPAFDEDDGKKGAALVGNFWQPRRAKISLDCMQSSETAWTIMLSLQSVAAEAHIITLEVAPSRCPVVEL